MERYCFQSLAALKGIIADRGNSAGDINCLNLGAAAESIFSDHGSTVLNHHCLKGSVVTKYIL